LHHFNPDYRARVWQLEQALHLVRARQAPSALRVSGTVTQSSFVYVALTEAASWSEDGTRPLLQKQSQSQIQ